MISKRTVFLLILLLLFLGAVYASQKRLKLPVYAGTLHPANTDKYGTAKFVELLKDYGFRVSVGGIEDLLTREYGLYILIGPDVKISPEEAGEILSYVKEGGNAIIASEFDDIEEIIKMFHIYPSTLISYLDPKNLKDHLINVSCSICTSFDSIELDIPNSFIILASKKDLYKNFFIIETGVDYIKYRYSINGSSFTAIATGKIVDLNNEFKNPMTKGLFGERTSIREVIYISDILHIIDLLRHSEDIPEDFIGDMALFTNEYTMIFIDVDGGGRIVFLSDTSPFINFYLERGLSKPLINDLLEFLQIENREVLLDVEHYSIIEASVKLPHLGRMILTSIHEYIINLDREYTSFLSENTLLLMGAITLVGLSMFVSLRRYLKIRDEAQLAGEDVVERDIIISTQSLIPMKDIYGRNFKEFIVNTYSFASLLISEIYGVSIADILKRKSDVDPEIYESVNYIASIYNRVSRKIVFPPIINKRRVVERLLKALDIISSRGGANR